MTVKNIIIVNVNQLPIITWLSYLINANKHLNNIIMILAITVYINFQKLLFILILIIAYFYLKSKFKKK